MKTCTRCDQTKPLDAFTRQRKAADGRHSWCKDCAREVQRTYRTDADFRDRAAAVKRQRYATDLAYREAIKASNKRRVESDPDAVRAAERRWELANRDAERTRKRALMRRRRASAPERERIAWRRHTAARRARKRNQFVEHIDPTAVYEMHGGRCGICGEFVPQDDFHVDHVVPLALGGLHGYINVQPAHPFCNLSKHAKPVAS